MANKFQIKRTTVSGRTPNTTNSSNTAYIDAGELAINLTDEKLFSSNGTTYFEVGANLTNLSVSGNTTLKTLVANGSVGTNKQVLASNGSTVYWTTVEEAGGAAAAGYGTVIVSNTQGTNTSLTADTVNTALTFIGESGISLFANSQTREVTVAVQPGLQGLSVDYGSIDEEVFAYFDYGTLN